jgi:hypothetical protein
MSGRQHDADDSIVELYAAFAALGHEYRFRKASAEAAVRTWRWATGCWFDPRPLFFEQNGFPRGRTLREPPAQLDGRVCCGFDAEGRVTVEREFNPYGYKETFLNWHRVPVESALYDYGPEKMPINLVVVWRDGQRATRSAAAAIHGYTSEEYLWAEHGVTEIRVAWADRKEGRLGTLQSHRVLASYSKDGKLHKVDRLWPPRAAGDAESIETMFERRGTKIFRPHP